MPKKTNSASRLYPILAKASGLADNISTLEAWTKVFEIEEQRPSRRALRVVEQLRLMHDELELVRKRMTELSASEDLYVPYVNRLEEAISTHQLNTPWSNHKVNLQPETLLSLIYCSDILPHEEDQIDSAALTDLQIDVEGLEELLKTSKLPDSLRDLIARHLEKIRAAIAKYEIVGAKALREASRSAVVEVIENQEEVREHAKTPEVGRFAKIVTKTSRIADTVIKTGKLIDAGSKIVAFLENLLPK